MLNTSSKNIRRIITPCLIPFFGLKGSYGCSLVNKIGSPNTFRDPVCPFSQETKVDKALLNEFLL